MNAPPRIAYASALAVGLLLSVFLVDIPVQLSDSFTEFTAIQGRSLQDVVSGEFHNGAYFRPFRRGLIKIVYDLSRGQYQLAFRGFQALQVIVLLLLVVRMLRIRDRAGLLALPLGLAMLVGIHTFADQQALAFVRQKQRHRAQHKANGDRRHAIKVRFVQPLSEENPAKCDGKSQQCA